jgi:hypothetical protein
MSIRFQNGQLEPWNDDIKWAAKLYAERDASVSNAMGRLDDARHKGKGFIQRIRTEDWSKTLQWQEVDNKMHVRIQNSELGQYVVTRSLKSGFRVFVRKVEVDPVIQTVGVKDIDILFDFIFEECKDLKPVSAGICNRRPIDGLSIPSQHAPWEDLNDGQGKGARALDVITQPMTVAMGNELRRRVIENKDTKGHCGKILFNNQAWEPGEGIRPANIGHTGHLHLESFKAAPSLWSLVRASCP